MSNETQSETEVTVGLSEKAYTVRAAVIGFAAAESVFLADFFTKWLATRALTPEGFPGHTLSLGQFILPSPDMAAALAGPDFAPMEVIPGYFNFYLAHNTGGAFSLFSGNPGILAGVSLVIIVAILWWARSFDRTRMLPFVGVGMLIGGALGNIADRLRFEYVVDFLDVYIGQSHWPTFNLADTFIDVGLAILVILALFTKQLEPKEKE